MPSSVKLHYGHDVGVSCMIMDLMNDNECHLVGMAAGLVLVPLCEDVGAD